MSARVVKGLAPAGKPHPATKWSLLIALLVVVVLGVPKIASASDPQVQPPTGPQSGGDFTSTYTFGIYMYCVGGPDYNTSYSNNLNGTHTFDFYGAADGSLLVSIDGGGMLVLDSCGAPNSGPFTNVITYTVTKGSGPPPPTPTPTQTPNPTPSPTPNPTATPQQHNGGGATGGSNQSGGTGTSSNNSGSSSPSQNNTPATSTTQSTTISSTSPQVTSTTGRAQSKTDEKAPSTTKSLTVPPNIQATSTDSANNLSLAWIVTGFTLLGLALLAFFAFRNRQFREFMDGRFRRMRVMTEPYLFRLRHLFKSPMSVHGKLELKRKGLSPHHHSGKLLAHHHTSYAALAFLLLISFVLAGAVSYVSRADSSDSSVLSLTVQGPPPTIGATITSPSDGNTLTVSPITVRGTCPSGLFLEIWRNGVFAGDTACDVNDLYSLLVTPVSGSNALIARDVDGLGQYGPDSPTVTITYNPPPPPPSPTPTPTPFPTQAPASPHATAGAKSQNSSPTQAPASTTTPKQAALSLTTQQHFYQGADVGTAVAWNITISGGNPPYSLGWEWGDGQTNTTQASAPSTVTYQHTYQKPGIYQVTIRAYDSVGHTYTLQLVVVINGAITSASLGQQTGDPGNLVTFWPILTVTSLIVISMWLGEHHKLEILRPANNLTA